jgi:hypothetical protein
VELIVARRKTAREMEMDAAAGRPLRSNPPRVLTGEAIAMLTRRGLRPRTLHPDLPFPPEFGGEEANRLSALLGHYAFRLFLRGAIQKSEGFAADQATPYVTGASACTYADALVDIGIARRLAGGLYRRIKREVWALSPHLYAVNSRPDLMANVALAIAEGLNALAPPTPWMA